jgi:hypothetical protein
MRPTSRSGSSTTHSTSRATPRPLNRLEAAFQRVSGDVGANLSTLSSSGLSRGRSVQRTSDRRTSPYSSFPRRREPRHVSANASLDDLARLSPRAAYTFPKTCSGLGPRLRGDDVPLAGAGAGRDDSSAVGGTARRRRAKKIAEGNRMPESSRPPSASARHAKISGPLRTAARAEFPTD